MKKIYYYTIIGLAATTLSLTSCNDSFLQQDPIQELAEGSFLTKVSDFPYYLNQLYPLYVTGHYNGHAQDRWAPYNIQGSQIAYGDMVSDNLVAYEGGSGNPSNRLDNTFKTPNSGKDTGWDWDNLKKVNYFLRHYKGAVGNETEKAAYAAEAYFFKAWDYYRKLVILGEVPWFEYDLNVDSPELFAPRTPRAELADSILMCLNFAVDHLESKGNADGRINKDMANFLKARFCLFEGTFRKYHQTDVAPMPTVPGDYEKFLRECVTACEEIINTNRFELYKNPADKAADGSNNSYWKMFTFNQNPSANGNKEAILTRVYGEKLKHGFTRYYIMGGARNTFGASKGLLDEYLCIDGKPIGTPGDYNPNFKGYDGGDWRELDNRDPRLKQTVAKPGEYITVWTRDAIGDIPAGTMDATQLKTYYPGITYNVAGGVEDPMYRTTVTGYGIIKHWTPNASDYGATSSLLEGTMFRYAEVLLMLAEAKAELGTLDQGTVDITINKLRERAGFPTSAYLDIANIPADPRLDAIYADKLDYTVSPLLREVRRERRVEMMMEGLRREDLIRWKAGRLMEVPMRGMKFTPEKQAIYDGNKKGMNDRKTEYARQAELDTNVFLDDDGFIIGFPKATNVKDGTLVWHDKYYYFPIPYQELSANENLKQNPYWED